MGVREKGLRNKAWEQKRRRVLPAISYYAGKCNGRKRKRAAEYINNDGSVDALDAQLVLNNVLDLMLGNETAVLSGGDIDGDGKITVLDAQYIMQFYLHNDVIGVPTMWRDVIAK